MNHDTQPETPMLQLKQRVEGAASDGVLCLPFDIRQKSRFTAALADGTEVGVILARGQVLRHGDCLASVCGRVVRIEAAPEPVSTVYCTDATLLARVCYHLGNRHVPLEIGAGFARYRHDHVLDDMVRGLGVEPASEQAPFEPEAGAYGGGHHHHGHDHAH
jgi:urease accessory protein